MASCRSQFGDVVAVAAVVAVAVVAVAVAVNMVEAVGVIETQALKVGGGSCSTADKYVYPWKRFYPGTSKRGYQFLLNCSFCENPATLKRGYAYVPTSFLASGPLEPVWDESNAAYYVRLTGLFGPLPSNSGSYVAVVASNEEDGNGILLVNSTVYIYNANTQRALQWRQQGSDEYFLIEQEVNSITEGAPFRFVKARRRISHPASSSSCPPATHDPAPDQCYAYYLLSDPSATSTPTGLLTHRQPDDDIYIKNAPLGSVGDLPLIVLDDFDKPSRTIPFHPALTTY